MAALLRTLLRRAPPPPPPPCFALVSSKLPLPPVVPPTPFHSSVTSPPFPSNHTLDPLGGVKGVGGSNPFHSLYATAGMQFPNLVHLLGSGPQEDACMGDSEKQMIWADSVKRKRKVKMNKHKHQKRQKLLRKKT